MDNSPCYTSSHKSIQNAAYSMLSWYNAEFLTVLLPLQEMQDVQNWSCSGRFILVGFMVKIHYHVGFLFLGQL